jgi:hypothetical protein
MTTTRHGATLIASTTCAVTELDHVVDAARREHAAGVDLHWIPLGAGGHCVRFNGVVYEAVCALIERRPRCGIYHAALQVTMPDGTYSVEMTPVPNARSWERGVVSQGPVGSKRAGWLRIFRYEIRRWRDGVIPDLAEAVSPAVRLTEDPVVVQRVFELLADVPTLTWGRDERRTGEMWTCNSAISWVLIRAGVDATAVTLPPRGRAPGWDAGITIAVDEHAHSPSPSGASEPTVPPPAGPERARRRGGNSTRHARVG